MPKFLSKVFAWTGSAETSIKNFWKGSRGHTQWLGKFFRALIYRAHRAVIFAIAQLSCFPRDGVGLVLVVWRWPSWPAQCDQGRFSSSQFLSQSRPPASKVTGHASPRHLPPYKVWKKANFGGIFKAFVLWRKCKPYCMWLQFINLHFKFNYLSCENNVFDIYYFVLQIFYSR